MKQVYRIKTNYWHRPQLCGKGRVLRRMTVFEAQAQLERAAEQLVRDARWHGWMTPIDQLRKPLLELRLARRARA